MEGSGLGNRRLPGFEEKMPREAKAMVHSISASGALGLHAGTGVEEGEGVTPPQIGDEVTVTFTDADGNVLASSIGRVLAAPRKLKDPDGEMPHVERQAKVKLG